MHLADRLKLNGAKIVIDCECFAMPEDKMKIGGEKNTPQEPPSKR